MKTNVQLGQCALLYFKVLICGPPSDHHRTTMLVAAVRLHSEHTTRILLSLVYYQVVPAKKSIHHSAVSRGRKSVFARNGVLAIDPISLIQPFGRLCPACDCAEANSLKLYAQLFVTGSSAAAKKSRSHFFNHLTVRTHTHPLQI